MFTNARSKLNITGLHIVSFAFPSQTNFLPLVTEHVHLEHNHETQQTVLLGVVLVCLYVIQGITFQTPLTLYNSPLIPMKCNGLRWLNTVSAVCECVICQIMARERLQLTS